MSRLSAQLSVFFPNGQHLNEPTLFVPRQHFKRSQHFVLVSSSSSSLGAAIFSSLSLFFFLQQLNILRLTLSFSSFLFFSCTCITFGFFLQHLQQDNIREPIVGFFSSVCSGAFSGCCGGGNLKNNRC